MYYALIGIGTIRLLYYITIKTSFTDVVKLKNVTDYKYFRVVSSESWLIKRIIIWFYNTHHAPDHLNWKYTLSIFFSKMIFKNNHDIPFHILEFCKLNNEKISIYVYSSNSYVYICHNNVGMASTHIENVSALYPYLFEEHIKNNFQI